MPCSSPPSFLYPAPKKKISALPVMKNKASLRYICIFFVVYIVFLFLGKGRVCKSGGSLRAEPCAPPSPPPPPSPQKNKRGGRKGAGEENMPFPATPPWQRAHWPGPWGKKGSPLWCYRADLEIFWGGGWRHPCACVARGARTGRVLWSWIPARLRQRAGTRPQPLCFYPWCHLGRRWGDGDGGGGVPLSLQGCSSRRGAQLNVPFVPGEPLWAPSQGRGCPRGGSGGGRGNRRGKGGKKINKRAGVGRGKCHGAERGLKGRGEARPTPLSARLWYQNGHFYRGRGKKNPAAAPKFHLPSSVPCPQAADGRDTRCCAWHNPPQTHPPTAHLPVGRAEATSLGSSQCHLLLQQCTLRLSEDFTPQNYTPNPGRETEVAAGKD